MPRPKPPVRMEQFNFTLPEGVRAAIADYGQERGLQSDGAAMRCVVFAGMKALGLAVPSEPERRSFVRHINGDPNDLSLENLRIVR